MADDANMRFLWPSPDPVDPSVQLMLISLVDDKLRIPEGESPEKTTGMQASAVLGFYTFLHKAYTGDIQRKDAIIAKLTQQRDKSQENAKEWKGYFTTLHSQSQRLEELQGAQPAGNLQEARAANLHG
jgi:hypothetical protein